MIHQYISNGYYIVLDVNSGSVHVVDEQAYRAIPIVEEALAQKIENKEEIASYVFDKLSEGSGQTSEDGASMNKKEIQETVEEILELYKAGMLYTEDVYEKYIGEFKNRQTVVKALCLHIAHDCNLACKYCFAEEGEYHGRRALMSYEVGKKALDFLVANSGSRVNLEVDFFGGEPLMNWQGVKIWLRMAEALKSPIIKNSVLR